MPSKIDQNLLPPVIRESVDPEILARAQSIEWTINRDTGEDEHGYVDGSHEDYLSSQNLLPKTHGMLSSGNTGSMRKSRKLEWLDEQSGRDSGYDATPTSPSLGGNKNQHVDMSPLDDPTLEFAATGQTTATGPMKSFPRGQYPFPIYNVNQAQLEGDVVFEPAPRARPGERTVHYEKSSRILNEEELEALGLNPKVFGPNSRTTMDEQEEEMIQTSVMKGGSRELEDFYNQHIRNDDADEYFGRQRARSVSPTGNRQESSASEHKKTIVFGSVDEIDQREQEFYPYRDAHQGKVSRIRDSQGALLYIYISLSLATNINFNHPILLHSHCLETMSTVLGEVDSTNRGNGNYAMASGFVWENPRRNRSPSTRSSWRRK